MLRTLLAASLSLVSLLATAQTVDAPKIKSGDNWVYRVTHQTGNQGWTQQDNDATVDHVDATTIFLSLKQSGSQQAPAEKLAGIDWSHSRDVNGKQQVVSRPFDFPLEVGKKWQLKVTEANPNRQHSSESMQLDYVVVGWEDVEVPAGKFKALKVEAEGTWTAELAPSNQVAAHAVNTQGGSAVLMQSNRVTPHTISGRIYHAYWYVPSVKSFVKSIDETYTPEGTRSSRLTDELVSDKVST